MRRSDKSFDPFAESTVDGIIAGAVEVKVTWSSNHQQFSCALVEVLLVSNHPLSPTCITAAAAGHIWSGVDR